MPSRRRRASHRQNGRFIPRAPKAPGTYCATTMPGSADSAVSSSARLRGPNRSGSRWTVTPRPDRGLRLRRPCAGYQT